MHKSEMIKDQVPTPEIAPYPSYFPPLDLSSPLEPEEETPEEQIIRLANTIEQLKKEKRSLRHTIEILIRDHNEELNEQMRENAKLVRRN